MTFKTGDAVWIICEGRRVPGTVLMASANGKSLALSFEAMLAGHAGMMPVLQHDDGAYRSLVGGVEVKLESQR